MIADLSKKGILLKPPVNIKGKFVAEPPCHLTLLGHLHVMQNFTIGAFSYISGNFSSAFSVKIGRYCSLAPKVSIKGDHPMHYFTTSPVFFNPNNPFSSFTKIKPLDFKKSQPPSLKSTHEVKIGYDVWMGEDVFIKPGVTIGDGAVIGAKSVVTKDISPYAIVAGVPAKLIRYRFDKDIIDLLLESKWWEFAPWQLKGAQLDDINEFIKFVNGLRENGVKPYKPRCLEF